MIKTTTAAVLLFMTSMVFMPSAATSSPNECEAIIVEVLYAQDRGQISNEEAARIIRRCSRATWGND